jgi:hypothetical protein
LNPYPPVGTFPSKGEGLKEKIYRTLQCTLCFLHLAIQEMMEREAVETFAQFFPNPRNQTAARTIFLRP